MKPNSATPLIASLDWLKSKANASTTAPVILGAGASILCILLFLAGRASATVPAGVAQTIASLQSEIRWQQGQVDRLIQRNEAGVNALAARLAELQAASTRLDALGQRLVQMGQLTLDEFDFNERAAIGGPADYDAFAAASEKALHDDIAALSDKLRRQSTQLDTLHFLMMNRQFESELTPAGWPVTKGWISSRFGERNDPFTGAREQHRGLDFAGMRGSDVVSVAAGVVTWSANRAEYGNTVEIDHGNGYQTRYAHNEKLFVNVGDHVKAGQQIATMGDSGRASAPHVHFEVLHDGARVNPSKFVGQIR